TVWRCTAGPSAELRLLYRGAVLARTFAREVTARLAECDFCDAELYLLSKFPPLGLPNYAPVVIPEPLYRLAKELLTNAPRVFSRTLELIYDSDRLSLTDA